MPHSSVKEILPERNHLKSTVQFGSHNWYKGLASDQSMSMFPGHHQNFREFMLDKSLEFHCSALFHPILIGYHYATAPKLSNFKPTIETDRKVG